MGESTLEQSGVKSVLRRLPEVVQGLGLSGVLGLQSGAAGQHVLSMDRELKLERLRLHWPDDPEPHAGGQQPAQVGEEKQTLGFQEIEPKHSEDGTKTGGKMSRGIRRYPAAVDESLEPRLAKHAARCGPKGAPLSAARAVGDVIGGEGVAPVIELREARWIPLGGRHPGQNRMARLVEAGHEVSTPIIARPDGPVLPRGFNAAGVREAPGGKGGINPLPHPPVIWRRFKAAPRFGRGYQTWDIPQHGSEQVVTLRERKDLRRLASEQHAVGMDLVGLGIDRDFGHGVVPLQVLFAD